MTRTPLLEFARQYSGSYVTAPRGLGEQCVDLANVYLLSQGRGEVYSNAADWAEARIPGYIWVPNSPDNYPTPGSIVVWRGNVPGVRTSAYGHVAIALAADSRTLLTLDQDWPTGSPCAPVLHSYEGVEGWHQLT